VSGMYGGRGILDICFTEDKARAFRRESSHVAMVISRDTAVSERGERERERERVG
jgi:hypothetical protein